MKQWTVKEPYLAVKGGLLEGPLYDENRREAQFIDINEEFLYTFNPHEGSRSLKKTKISDAVAVTANIQNSNEELISGAKYGFATIDKSTGALTYLRRFWGAEDGSEKSVRMRSNDGAIDSHGRFWVGTMIDHRIQPTPDPEGILFRLDRDLSVHRMLHHIHTPNGIGWNSADDTMFWTDSVDQNIYAFDFDVESGSISNRRIFYHVNIGVGINPDGLAVDSEDCVWTAIWGAGKVLRISQQGQLIGEVIMPTKFATCPAFIGTELLITTARDPEIESDSVERGGDVFKLDVGVTGARKHEFRFLAN